MVPLTHREQSSPLALSRYFFTIITQDYNLLKHTVRDFLCSNTQVRDFYNQSPIHSLCPCFSCLFLHVVRIRQTILLRVLKQPSLKDDKLSQSLQLPTSSQMLVSFRVFILSYVSDRQASSLLFQMNFYAFIVLIFHDQNLTLRVRI